jgi:hypothetical protein
MREPAAVLPPSPGTGALTLAQRNRARLRLAWEMRSQVGEHADLLPLGRGGLCAVSPTRGCGAGGGMGRRGMMRRLLLDTVRHRRR